MGCQKYLTVIIIDEVHDFLHGCYLVGRVRVTGHVKGYVQGEIDADIQGTFQGQMKVSVDSLIPGRQGQVTYEDTDNLLLTDKSDGVENTENVTNNTEKGDEQ